MTWLLQLITEPGCGIDSDSDPQAISIPIAYDSLSEAQKTLNNIVPGGDQVLNLVVSRDESGEPIIWVKIPESKVKCVWLTQIPMNDE